MAYGLIKISALPAATPDESQEIVVGVGDLAKRINYGDVKNDMVGTSPTYTTDTEPYLMRQTAHVGVVGKCALNKLVGGSLGWNQLVQALSSSWTSESGVTATYSNGVATIASTVATNGIKIAAPSVIVGHKYLLTFAAMSSNSYDIRFGYTSASGIQINGQTSSSWQTFAAVKACVATHAQVYIYGTTTYSGLQVRNAMIFDLTQMFGSTIADYVYGLEQATAGAGIAKLKSWGIDLGTYHAYDAGSIQNVQATAHVTTGKNLLDVTNETSGSNAHIREYNLPDLPLGTYTVSAKCVSTASTGCAVLFIYKDGTSTASTLLTNGSWSSKTIDITKPVKALRIYSANNYATAQSNTVEVTSAQLEFGSTATAYEPYMTHTYPLGSDTLRGIPQLVSNKLQFDGDEKYPDGTITRKYGIVDLGTLTWAYQSNTGMFYSGGYSDMKAGTIKGIVSNGYKLVSGTSAVQSIDKTICKDSNGRLYAHDSAYSTAAAFQTAISGTYMVYEKNTETTESSTAFQKIQTIDADGTESFTTSSPVPVGHETQTPDNILAALGWLGE